MKLFPERKSSAVSQVAATGVPRTYKSGIGSFQANESFTAQKQLYSSLRKNIPVIDGAISKIVRLTGGFKVKCKNPSEEKALADFLEKVAVGGNMTGIASFTDLFLDQLLTYGTAVGEMVLNKDNRTFSLFNGELDNIILSRKRDNPMHISIETVSDGKSISISNDSRIILGVLDPDTGNIHGKSLLRGLPFVSAVLMQIFEATGTNWERLGNLRYAVTYRPQNDAIDKAYATERAMQIAKGWSDAMKSDEVRDFIAVGDVDIKVIGADNQILDSEIPVRQLMEQIVAKTGLPPFMLGLSWSTSERMAKQQTDLLTSELWHYRRLLTPVIMKICRMFLRMNGFNESCRVEWDEISLLDETEQAKALYYNAQAEKYHEEALALRKEKTDG